MCAPVGKGQHLVGPTQASTIFKFLNFQSHRGHVYNNLWKFHHNRMNGVYPYTTHTQIAYLDIDFYIGPIDLISNTIASMFTITFESYNAIGWTVYAPVGKVQHGYSS